jgi:hypothetical protein
MKTTIATILIALSLCLSAAAQKKVPELPKYHCVYPPIASICANSTCNPAKYNVLVLPCQAALLDGESLNEKDSETLFRMSIIRDNMLTFSTEDTIRGTSEWKPMLDAIREGFGQKVGEICSRHGKIMLAPLSSTDSGNTLYSCDNVIGADIQTK